MTLLADLATLVLVAAMALVYDPESLDPLAPRLPLALLILPAALVASAGARARVSFQRADALVVVALVLTAVSTALSPAPWASGPALVAALIAAGAYLLGRRAGERPALLELAAKGSLLALVAIGVLLIGFVAQPSGPALTDSVPTGALVGPLANPDLMASWLLLVAPVAALGRPGKPVLGLALVALAWTLSRGALLAAAATALRVHRPARALRPLGLALIGALVFVGYAAVRPADRAKLTSVATPKKRVAIWRTALSLYRARPLFGHGPGRFPHLYEAVRPEDPVTGRRMPPSEFAHNLPLQVAVEHGLAGLALLALAAGGLIRRLAAPGDAHARALLAGLAAFALHNLVSHSAYVLPVLALAALWTGAAVTRSGALEPPASPRAYPLLCMLAALVLFFIAPWGLSRNRAAHHAGLAQAALARHQAAAAVPDALAALAEAPNQPHVRYLAAGALAEGQRPAAALAQYLLLEAAEPAFGHQAYDRARVLLDMDRAAPALPALERELAADPDFFPAWYARAEAHHALGDRVKSRLALDRARTLAPTPEVLRRLDELARTLDAPAPPSR